MSSSTHLPLDLQIEILEKLPVKSLLRFKCVCKLWLSTIESPHFARKQLEKSANQFSEAIFIQNCNTDSYQFYSADASSGHVRTLHPPFERQLQSMIGSSLIAPDIEVCSCDGLLLLRDSLLRTLFLWNPSTNKFKEIEIPPPPLSRPESSEISIHGFGYDSSIQDYKIVVINLLDGKQNEVLVFTLKTNSWRTIQSFPSCIEILAEKISVSIHGEVHFLGLHDGLKETIIRFNLADESFTTLPLPPNCHWACNRLNVVGNRLHIHYWNYLNVWRWRSGYEVWSMTEYGNKDSWYLIMTHPIPSKRVRDAQEVNDDLLAVEDRHLHLTGRDDAERELIQKKYKFYPIDADDSMVSYVESLVCP